MKTICSVVLFVFLSFSALSKTVISAAVSPEFPEGLHYKFLAYLAQQLDMELKVYVMPLARRLKELEKGNIDILVLSYRDAPELIFIDPAYEKIDFGLFVRQEDQAKLNKMEEIYRYRVGYSIGANLPLGLGQDDKLDLVAVSSLQQKISLLELNRIDAFWHVLEGAENKLKNMNKHEVIVKSQWQPDYKRKYHFVISEKSALFNQQKRVSQVIDSGIKADAFQIIRKQHYQ